MFQLRKAVIIFLLCATALPSFAQRVFCQIGDGETFEARPHLGLATPEQIREIEDMGKFKVGEYSYQVFARTLSDKIEVGVVRYRRGLWESEWNSGYVKIENSLDFELNGETLRCVVQKGDRNAVERALQRLRVKS